jgi:anti-sigma B factor antagonist
MDIVSREMGDIMIISFIGRLDTATSSAAEAAIRELLVAGSNKIIINLADTEWVSSSGLRVFLVTAKKVSVVNGFLKLCQANDVVTEILEISGFSTILSVFASEEEALTESGY